MDERELAVMALASSVRSIAMTGVMPLHQTRREFGAAVGSAARNRRRRRRDRPPFRTGRSYR
ncbi:hypothetical protein I553_8444 [Mycobacterium xenopi 4042]|uniref:Uncharacterized protein n=1 Tax=Mycobacterium xenopi 4042 TaxID=1299334 RepID=X8CKN4_MYCXE|nr:hypothetical protein I553_8444 [Mycobacterium xenopi 4042]